MILLVCVSFLFVCLSFQAKCSDLLNDGTMYTHSVHLNFSTSMKLFFFISKRALTTIDNSISLRLYINIIKYKIENALHFFSVYFNF